MTENVINLLVAAVTILLTNIFSYLFALKKEGRNHAVHYKIETLDKIYTPIYKILIQRVIPGDGYEGIDDHQLESIIKITDDHVNLVDPKLNKILWNLREEAQYIWQTRGDISYIILDENRVLMNHVESYYNLLRKAVGLPYEKPWQNKLFTLKKIFRRKYNSLKRLMKKRKKAKW